VVLVFVCFFFLRKVLVFVIELGMFVSHKAWATGWVSFFDIIVGWVGIAGELAALIAQ
jgi:hypothetical protein